MSNELSAGEPRRAAFPRRRGLGLLRVHLRSCPCHVCTNITSDWPRKRQQKEGWEVRSAIIAANHDAVRCPTELMTLIRWPQLALLDQMILL